MTEDLTTKVVIEVPAARANALIKAWMEYNDDDDDKGAFDTIWQVVGDLTSELYAALTGSAGTGRTEGIPMNMELLRQRGNLWLEARTVLEAGTDQQTWYDGASGTFTCHEADSIAEALTFLGLGDLANAFLDGHAESDEEDDDEDHLARADAIREADRARAKLVIAAMEGRTAGDSPAGEHPEVTA